MSNTTTAAATLPPTYRALQITSPSLPAEIVTKQTPTLPPPSGTVIIKPIYANVVSYTSQVVQNGNPRGYPYPLPLVPGPSAIARIVATPADAPSLTPGQLVLVDPVIRTRDQETAGAAFLLGTHAGSGGPQAATYQIMEHAWRDGCFAELASVPVENVHVLDEEVLLGKFGYERREVGVLMKLAVPFGGLDKVGVKSGETVIVAPATGGFGGGAVHVALALGARVIAMGRNEAVLADLEALGEGKVATVKLSGTVEGDTAGIKTAMAKLGTKVVDVFYEISPPMVVDGNNQVVPYITAAIKALKKGGRIALMGGIQHDVSLPLWDIVHALKTLQGWWMYTPEQLKELIRLVETGVLRIGKERGLKSAGNFPLEKWEEAFETAAKEANAVAGVMLVPNEER